MASTKRSGEDEGVVTSAPAGLGSLLTDLLSDVKKSVEAEQKQKVDTETDRRAQEEQERREQDEGRRREEAQRKLIDEARRRNEELGKVRGELDRKQASTAQHARPQVEPAMTGPRSTELKVATGGGKSKFLMVGLVVVGVGAGFGTAFAMQPEQRGAFMDVNAAAKTTLAVVSRMAQAESKFTGDLTRLKGDMGALEKRISDANDEQKKLKTDNDTLKAELEKAQKQLAAGGETKPVVKHNTGSNSGNPGGVPTLNTGLFATPGKKTP